MRIYTRTGDQGGTHLAGGARVPKSAPRVAAYGEVDELNAVVGFLRTNVPSPGADEQLSLIQNLLLEVGAFLADPRGRHQLPAHVTDLRWLERWIDEMEEGLDPLRNFILPGGSRAAAIAHLARTVCRRSERSVVALQEAGEATGAVIPLLNRLSDAFFVLARWLNARDRIPDVIWQAQR